ncbi:LOW QUALITY PROTEIN: hypothetical protein HZS_4097 [Henneguya salminicola]|nr:LOW QUALITY PROTEIN: hypothetical protein HZS_4097 [Henneguya salminicola]
MFSAFAFIEEDNVIRAYEALEEHICLNEIQRTSELGTFIGRHHRTGRSQSLFSIRLCNQFEGTESGISRTNNKVEASLQRKLSLVDVKIETIHMHTTQQNTRPVYNQINRQLIELMERRHTIPIITPLEQYPILSRIKN